MACLSKRFNVLSVGSRVGVEVVFVHHQETWRKVSLLHVMLEIAARPAI